MFAHRNMLASDHLKTDFVMMVLYGLFCQTLEQIEAATADESEGDDV